jgi:hypothetical protein
VGTTLVLDALPLDCFVAALLAMTGAVIASPQGVAIQCGICIWARRKP